MRWKLLTVAVLLLAWLGAGSQRAARGATQRAARSDARTLLASLRLPAGVRRIASEPRFARPLAGGGSLDAAYNAGEESWWQTAATPESIITHVKAHKPRGASAIGAQSSASWIVPRAASERVPAGVHAIELSLRLGSGPFGERHMRTRTYLVWRRERVAAIVRQFDSMLIVQPGVLYSCPAEVGGEQRPELTLQFRAGPAGPALARATVHVLPGREGASGWNACDPIEFWIGAHAQTPLSSQTFVRSIGRLMGDTIS